jgi:hypothetical protein
VNKSEFDHGIRAAGGILGINEVLVIGSQAAHGSIPGELPPEALRSIEVDIAAFQDTDGSMADVLDGAIGEASMFQEQFGSTSTVSPRRRQSSPTAGATALCSTRLQRRTVSSRGAWSFTIYGYPRQSPGGRRTSSSARPSCFGSSSSERPTARD